MNNSSVKIEMLMRESDPFFGLLKSTKIRITPISAYFLFSIFPLTLESVFCYFKGCLFTASNVIGMWNEILNFSNFILFFPVVFTLYVWLPGGIESVFSSLQMNEIVPPTKNNKLSLIRFENYQRRILTKKIWFYLVGITAVLANFLLILPGTNKFIVWWNYYMFTFLLHHVSHVLALYFIFFSLVRIFQFISLLRYFFSQTSIDIKALHPDGCGGLKVLGAFSVRLGYVLGAVGASMVLVIYYQSYLMGGQLGTLIWAPSILLFVLIYSVCAPLTFFAPLGTAHRAMQKAKEKELLMVSSQFEIDYKNMMKLLPSRTNSIKKELEKIEQLKRLYKIVGDFPVWPFNYQNVLRFVISVIGPFLLAVFPSVLSLIIK